MYVGIDNGLDGGIVILDITGDIISAHPMPVMKAGKGRILDRELIRHLMLVPNRKIVIEQPEPHAPAASALRSLWYNFGILETIAYMVENPYHPVKCREWQGEFWKKPKMAKGQKFDNKAAALLAAGRIWPKQDWTKSDRATKPHDGMIDAALIAEWARRKNL